MSSRKRNSPPDYYRDLGVSPTATADEIKQAYRKRAFETHPDHNPGKDPAPFIAITEAYRILSDHRKRQRYDSSHNAETLPPIRDEREFLHYQVLAMAQEMIVRGRSRADVIDLLQKEGCPESLASEIESELRDEIKSSVSDSGGKEASTSAFVLMASIALIYLISHISRTLAFILYVILFFVGSHLVSNAMLGLYCWGTGRHPASVSPDSLKAMSVVGFVVFLAIMFLVGQQ